MIQLGIARSAPELRSSAGYTDQITAALLSRASTVVSARGHAAVETAAGLVSRSFALADVSPAVARVALSPATMAIAGRQMFERASFLLTLRLASTGIVCLPCGFWDVRGSDPLPETWQYSATTYGPHSAITRLLDRAGVLHAVSDGTVQRPWEGRGALR